jgi:quercetin dioxygenase-like cupin family protein
MEDHELKRLLSEWKAPDAPRDMRPRRTRRSSLGWLADGTIRVPVAIAVAALFSAVTFVTTRPDAPLGPEPSAPRINGEIARYSLGGTLDGFDAVLVGVNVEPGPSRPEHRHPGAVLGYVLDGQVAFAIDGNTAQILEPGDTFYEPDGAVHTTFASAEPEGSARVVVFLVVPTGSPLSRPAQP